MQSLDFRSFQPVTDKKDKGSSAPPRPERAAWWEAPAASVHTSVFALAESMELEQMMRRRTNEVLSRLYGDGDVPNVFRSAMSAGYAPVLPYLLNGRITYNLVRVACDTLAAKIAKSKPKATFVTDGGTWVQRRRAKRADRFVMGVMHSGNVYAKARKVFLDALVNDVGVLKVYRAGQRVCFDRVDPDEIKVGLLDGRNGEPRTILQTRLVAREVLHRLVEDWHADEKKERRMELHRAVDEARAPTRTDFPQAIYALSDVVEVQEAWHLPTGEKGEGGRHVVAISTTCLLQEGYRRERFPFVPFRFAERRWGWYGQGVGERLAGRQRTINLKLRSANDALRLMSVPRYFNKAGSKFDVKQLRNEPGIVMTGLEPPQVLTGNVVPPELWISIEKDIAQGLEEVGVSMLSAAARKPAGLDSAPSLREFNDIESERFALVSQAWEEFFVELGHHVVDLAHEAEEEKTPLDVLAPPQRRGERLEKLSWKDVKLDEETYVLKAFPTSSLPTTPAARKKAVQEWYEGGLIDTYEFRRLMDVPDLDAANNVDMAAREDIDATVERFLDTDDGKDLEERYEPPEPYQDLAYGLKRFTSAYLRARNEGAPEESLELLRRWLAQAEQLMAMATQQAPPAEGAPLPPGAMPPGAGVPAAA